MKKLLFYIPLIILALLPIIPWILMQPLSVRFDSASQALVSLGQVTALTGTALFALVVIMRSKLFSKSIWSGTSESLQRVRRVGEVTSFLLLLSHPIILAVKLAPVSFLETMQFFLPRGDWAFNFGIYALLLLLAFYGIRFCSDGGEKLRAAPLVLSTILFLGTLHAFFIPSSLSESLLLKSYVLSLVGLAVVINIPAFFLLRRKNAASTTLKRSS